MKLLVTSDLHGNLPVINDAFDLMLICGDICPAHDHYYSFQIEWIRNEFVNWINSLPANDKFSKVVIIPGNHDFWGERATRIEFNDIERLTNGRLKILRHEPYEYSTPYGNVLKIFGTPYCTEFGNWAFMVSDKTRKKKFSQIPEGIDILMSHQPVCTNQNGTILRPYRQTNELVDAGCKVLTEELKRIKPKYFFAGHIHSGNHKFENVDGTMMANVSYVDERYDPVYEILKINIDETV